jgi:hypothetical protein
VLQREQDDLERQQQAKAEEINRLLKALVIDVGASAEAQGVAPTSKP